MSSKTFGQTSNNRKDRRRKAATAGRVRKQHTANTPYRHHVSLVPHEAKESATDPHALARRYIQVRGMNANGTLTIRYWNGQFYRWEEGQYAPVGHDNLSVLMNGAIKDHFYELAIQGYGERSLQSTPPRTSSAIHALKSMTFIDAEEAPVWLDPREGDQSVFAFTNGLVYQDAAMAGAGELQPLDPLWFSTTRFPLAYDAAATCPKWQGFLEQVLPEEGDRLFLQEMFGYCLTTDVSMQRFFILYGKGANGKGVVVDVLTSLVGRDAVSNVDVAQFAADRFALVATVGKLINFNNEHDPTEPLPEAKIKEFTAGDRMCFPQKHREAIMCKPTAKLVIATNELLQIRDRSEGMKRRLRALHFPVTVPADQRDRLLADKLKAELPGIFNWALRGLARLRERGRFEDSVDSDALLEEMRPAANAAELFLRTSCEAAPGAICVKDDLVSAFSTWGAENGYGEGLTQHDLYSAVRREFPLVRSHKQSSGARLPVYLGLHLRAVAEADPSAPQLGKVA